jgi:hypothetical protein
MADSTQDTMAEFFDFGGISAPEETPQLEFTDDDFLADFSTVPMDASFTPCATHPAGGYVVAFPNDTTSLTNTRLGVCAIRL